MTTPVKCAKDGCDEAPEFTFKANANDAASTHACARHAYALHQSGLVLVGKVPSAVMQTEVDHE